MRMDMSWRGWLVLAAIVILALMLVAHVVGYYVQMAVLMLALVVALALLVRHGYRRTARVFGRRGDRSRTRPR